LLYVLLAPTKGAALDTNPERWGFGVDAGVWAGMVGYKVRPTFAANLDYYVDRAFSVGPMVLVAPSSDPTQYAFAGVLRYHYRTRLGNIVPLVGLGLVHADYQTRSSTSYYIPLGMSFEYPLTKKLAFSTTGLFNLHNLFDHDQMSGTVLFGLRYGGPSPTRARRFGFAP
jgi:hypothetical protein